MGDSFDQDNRHVGEPEGSGTRQPATLRKGTPRHIGATNGAFYLTVLGIVAILIGIGVAIVSQQALAFWIIGGLGFQLWVVAFIVRPIEAIWDLLNERLPKKTNG